MTLVLGFVGLVAVALTLSTTVWTSLLVWWAWFFAASCYGWFGHRFLDSVAFCGGSCLRFSVATIRRTAFSAVERELDARTNRSEAATGSAVRA
jgi:hypothetical protein